MRREVDQRTELVEGEIWDVVRGSIQAGAMVRVMESATRIAAAHDKVMPLSEIAELLAEAAIAAGVPIEIEGLPLTARVSGGRDHKSNSFLRARICATGDPEQAP
jgi:hypothetical protein